MEYQLIQGDCLEVMGTLETGSVQLIATDPPYFRVKDEEWDRQWATADAFLQWMDSLCVEWKRILAPNGSLYVFASPQMAWHVEGVIRRHFNVISRVIWVKNDGDVENSGGKWRQADKDALRAYFPRTETIIFAEPVAADDVAKGTAGYELICFQLQKEVFRPLGDYFKSARENSGLTRGQIEVLLGYTSSSDPTKGTALYTRWEFGQALPSTKAYKRLRDLLGPELLPLERHQLGAWYEDLRREYEDLRREYEDLRRPFNATPDQPYTDVWTFPTVNAYPGKHPAEKPLELMRHIVRVSSRPGDVVLDSFMGSGTTGHAAAAEGRRFIGMEKDRRWFAKSRRRIAAAYGDWEQAQTVTHTADANHNDLPLFQEAAP